jgi:hypothetical protein
MSVSARVYVGPKISSGPANHAIPRALALADTQVSRNPHRVCRHDADTEPSDQVCTLGVSFDFVY